MGDGSLIDTVDLRTRRLVANALVVLDRSGPFLAAFDFGHQHRLTDAELGQLVALASGEVVDLDPGLATALDERGLLVAPSSEPTGAIAAAPLRTAVTADDPDEPYAGTYALMTPVALRVSPAGFEHLDHEGRALVALSVAELRAAFAFATPRTDDDAHAAHVAEAGADALDRDAFVVLRGRLEAARLLGRAGDDGEDTAEGAILRTFRRGVAQSMRRAVHVDGVLAERRAAEAERARRTGVTRIPLVPVTNGDIPLLSLGLVMSYAKEYDGGRLEEAYDFVPDWMNRTIPTLTADDPPGVFLFSNYLWSHRWNLTASADVKARNPANVTIHGGPDTPKYEADVEAYFRANPHVDINVHGEGELTLAEVLDALEPSLRAGSPDLDALADVAGLSYRVGDRIVRTAPRDRIADLDVVPSPFSNGLFDVVGDYGLPYLIVETNRGCPYGCTYCDWGSATLSRIRKFDLERVFEDLEWAARHQVEVIWNADANFGVFARDVEIAEKVVELKRQYGYPRLFGANYAKNTVKHLRQIVDTLVAGGILTTGTLSMQSADEETLLTIRRQNIKVDRYDDLAEEFSRNELPLVTELMMGLPGSTLTSFVADLQQCIDREMRSRVYPTELLVNSPMNEPSYREEHRIETVNAIRETWTMMDGADRTSPFVVATATFTREDYALMDRYRQQFFLFENLGVLRQVARFVRQETGLEEMAYYRRFEQDILADPARWPTAAFVFECMHEHTVVPGSWRLFIDEVGDHLAGVLGLADDDALRTVLAVQHSLHPARDRAFPHRLELAHDFAAWHRRMVGLKLGGHPHDWADLAPRLHTYGPASFEVTDPQLISTEAMGEPLMSSNEADWEMASPVGRTLSFLRTVNAG